MSPMVQVCIVVVTVSMVAIAIATIRAMMRFEAATHEFTRTAETVRDSVEHAEAVTRQVEVLVASMQSAMAPVQRAAARCTGCLLYTSPSPRDGLLSRMPSSA